MKLIHNWEECDGVPGGGTTEIVGECHCPEFPIKWIGGNSYGVSVVEVVESAKTYFLENSEYETADLLLKAAIARLNFLMKYHCSYNLKIQQAFNSLELARDELQDALPIAAARMNEAIAFLKEGVKA